MKVPFYKNRQCLFTETEEERERGREEQGS